MVKKLIFLMIVLTFSILGVCGENSKVKEDNTPFVEVNMGWGKPNYKGDVRYYAGDTLGLTGSYYISKTDANYNGEFETLQLLNIETGRNWGIYIKFSDLQFETSDLYSSGGLLLVDADNKRLVFSGVDMGLRKRILGLKWIDFYIGGGYKAVHVGVYEDSEFFAVDDKEMFDMWGVYSKVQIYPSRKIVIGGTLTEGFGKDGNRATTIDLNVSYGRKMFIRAGYLYQKFKVEKEFTFADGVLTLPYFSVGFYMR